jgi:hypothetical protein
MSLIFRKSMLFSLLAAVAFTVIIVSTAAPQVPATGTTTTSTTTASTCSISTTTTNPVPPPRAPAMSSVIPLKVPITTKQHSDLQARAYFDWFSWQSFIALNWPAAINPKTHRPIRGKANTSSGVTIASSGPRVWETYKADWETFRQGAQPTPWPSYAVVPETNPCAGSTKKIDGGSKLVAMYSKTESVLTVHNINQAFSEAPLIAQHGADAPPDTQYVRYEVHLNEAEYHQIRKNQWYLTAKLPVAPAAVVFPSTPSTGTVGAPYGAIEIKAAWKEILNPKEAPAYYTVKATVVEPGPTVTCRENVTLGLVGLHIAHKISPFREWVWSTFEHIDNVPDPHYPPRKSYSFNNGTDNPTTTNGTSYEPAPTSATQTLTGGPAVQVTRFTPIPSTPAYSTQQMNDIFQKFLASSPPWNNYELVATQWPTVTNGKQFVQNVVSGSSTGYPFLCDCPFPQGLVANSVVETYFQATTTTPATPPPPPPPLQHSCIQCHYIASAYDFSFLLKGGSYPPTTATPTSTSATNAARIEAMKPFLRATGKKR